MRDKKNENEKEIGSNREMKTRKERERERAVLQTKRDMCWEEREKQIK